MVLLLKFVFQPKTTTCLSKNTKNHYLLYHNKFFLPVIEVFIIVKKVVAENKDSGWVGLFESLVVEERTKISENFFQKDKTHVEIWVESSKIKLIYVRILYQNKFFLPVIEVFIF